MTTLPTTTLELRSLVSEDGTLELSLQEVELPAPGPDDVVVRIGAAPLNPSDLGLLFGGADMDQAEASGTAERPVLRAPLTPNVLRAMAGRVGQSLAVGNEAGGVVIGAGSSPDAQALVGRTVGVLGGGMYTEYRVVDRRMVLAMHDGVTPTEAASCFVNPLTALGMVTTMELDGHTALVHTAAASNLGQMLVKICLADDIPLVNVVRKPEQAELLRGIGAVHVVDTSSATFQAELNEALIETGATVAFDAVGGGLLASQLLAGMETAANARSTGAYSRYGSDTFKQVYIYGALDLGPTELRRTFGFSWSVSGWLLTPFLQRIGAEHTERLRQRVADEITTTFASHYTAEVDLAGALSLEAVAQYSKRATGQKYLVRPTS
ncbi:MAG: zinc-binding dehydrogenase [Ilumatobacteraceae bacterium]